MTYADHCNVVDCEQDVVSLLDGKALCRGHFISACYVQLDRYAEMQKGHGSSGFDTELMQQFINECVRQADEIIQEADDLDNLERSRLIHIIEEATDLGRYMRRSPRKAASIPVRLCCDKLGGAWEEDTETVLLSRHGASVQCRHLAKPGETVEVIRSDTGQKVQARVTWQRPSGDESVRIGVEFVDCDNFWGLDWAVAEENR
jgi:hypothetical protein